MLISKRGFPAFTEYDLQANLSKFLSDLRSKIESDSSVNEQDEEVYVAEKVAQATKDSIVLDVNNITVTQEEVPIPSSYFPNTFSIDSGKSYPKPVVTFHLPFKGSTELLKCRPSTRLMVADEIAVEGGDIIFQVINFKNDVQEVGKERDSVLSHLTEQTGYVNKDIAAYNAQLDAVVRAAFQTAKAKFKGQSDFLSGLGNKVKSE